MRVLLGFASGGIEIIAFDVFPGAVIHHVPGVDVKAIRAALSYCAEHYHWVVNREAMDSVLEVEEK